MSNKGTYTFKWPHGANKDVWVSGDFDDWKKSIQLEKKGDVYEKTIELESQKHLYKFIVDDRWITDDDKPKESDQNGIPNNVLNPSDITPLSAAISSVGPKSTTAAMVGDLPKEQNNVPGSFPETPGTDTVSVNPIPASSGTGNPISLAPGEKVPHHSTISENTIDSGVKLDKESYEKADAGPASDAVKSAESSVPPVSGTMIPESSLPMGGGAGPFLSSAGAGSTTAGLVGDLPKEAPRVPEVVSKSQEAAHVDPEASANPEAVAEKKDVESELKSKVPEEPAAAPSAGGIIGTVTGAAGAAAAAVTAAVVGTKDKAVEATSGATSGVTTGATSKPTEAVPEVVKESISKSGESAEAAGNPVAVSEKKDVEAELLKEVETTNKTGEPAPTATASTTDKAPGDGPSTTAVTTKDTPAVPAKKETTSEAPASTPKKENATPADATTPSTAATDKKSKRKSFFTKIKKILKEH